jgi:hypothetical protein
MPIWEFVILIGVLVWIGIALKTPWPKKPQTGWKYSVINVSGYDDVEKRLNEIGRWGRELVLIWTPQDADPKNHIYAVFKEPVPIGQQE